MDVLDAHVLELNLCRAEVGARQQGLDTLQDRLETEEFQLREVLSLEHDADMVEVLSNLTARQIALEATLLSTGKIFQMNLLQYI
jgi:flagellar hook-associated protein 3 FlgL